MLTLLGGVSNDTAEVLNTTCGQWTILTSKIPSGIKECSVCCVKSQIYVNGKNTLADVLCYDINI